MCSPASRRLRLSLFRDKALVELDGLGGDGGSGEVLWALSQRVV